jgi:hypothetical protein
MPLSISSGASRSLGFAGASDFPESLKFPANSVIPYYGSSTDTGLNDWARYSLADGYYLYSALNQEEIGITYPANAAGAYASGSTSSDGYHTGSAVTQNWRSATGGSTAQSAGSPGHTHTYSGSAVSAQDTLLNKQNITLLRATKSTRFLPINSLIVKQTALTGSVAFSQTGYNYLFGADQNLVYTTGSPYSFGAGLSVSSDYGHYHASSSSAYQTIANGPYYRNYSMGYGGAHSHSASVVFSQSQIQSKLVNLWKLTAALIPTTDIIVMYVGTLANLPLTWKLCDGLNGTVNLGGYVIGYSDNQWNVTTASNPYAALSFSSAYVSHSHANSYVPTANTSGPGAYHSNYGWSHSHNPSGSVSAYAYIPQRIGLAFIQYKG